MVFLQINLFAQLPCSNEISIATSNFLNMQSAYQLNGNATILGNGVLQLTNNSTWQNGSAFWKNRLFLEDSKSFSSNFSFSINPPFTGDYADGIAFVLQTVSNNAGSGAIGYDGITPSLAVEFDVIQNGGEPSNNHVAIVLNGTPLSAHTDVETPAFLMYGGSIIYAWIDYNGVSQQLEVRVNNSNVRPSTALLTKTVDLVTLFGNQNVFAGFTSSTGNAGSFNKIHSFNLENFYVPDGLSTTCNYVQAPTNIVINSNWAEVVIGQTQTFNATLYNFDGSFAPNRTITIIDDSHAFVISQTYVTNALGQVSFNVKGTMHGTSQLTIRDQGGISANYNFNVLSDGLAGNALNFDGIDDYVVTNNNVNIISNQPRTLEFWYKKGSSNLFAAHIVNWGISITDNAFGFYVNNNSYLFFYKHGVDFNTGYALDNNWHHIAASYDGSLITIFVDGIKIANYTYDLNTLNSPLYIGVRMDLGSDRFDDGTIDELRIWNTARTSCEISMAMNTTLVGNETGLVAYYNFNQGIADGNNASITTLNDLTSNNLDGTINNFASIGSSSNFTESITPIYGLAAFSDVKPPVFEECTDKIIDIYSGVDYTVDLGSFDPTITDCSSFTVTNNYNFSSTLNGETFPIGIYNIEWTAQDASGNISTCVNNVEIRPNYCVNEPTINNISFSTTNVCEGEQVMVTVDGQLNDASFWLLVNMNENVTIVGESYTNIITFIPSQQLLGTFYVYPISENCILQTSPSANANLNIYHTPIADADYIYPVCIGSEILLKAINTENGINYTWSDNVIDNVPFVVNQSKTYTLTATDPVSNCSSTKSVFVEVNDVYPPVFEDCTDKIINIYSGVDYSVDFGSLDPTITDCSSFTVTNNYNFSSTLNGVILPIGIYNIEWTAQDASGNISTCVNNIEIKLYIPNYCVNEPTINNISLSTTNVCEGEQVMVTVDGQLNDASFWLLASTSSYGPLVASSNTNIITFIPSQQLPGPFYVYPISENCILQTSPSAFANLDIYHTPIAVPEYIYPVCIGSEIVLKALNKEIGAIYTWSNNAIDNVPIVINQSNTYTLTATDPASNCSSTKSIFVEVNDVVYNTVDTIICQGSFIEIDGNQYNSNTSFTTTYSELFKCDSIVTYNITVNPLPTITLLQNYSNPICSGDEVVLTAQGANSYLWDNNITNGVPFVINNTTNFTVIATDNFKCSNTATFTINTINLNQLSNATWNKADYNICNGTVKIDVSLPQTELFYYLVKNNIFVDGPIQGNLSKITLTEQNIFETTTFSVFASTVNAPVIDFNNSCYFQLNDVTTEILKPIQFTSNPQNIEVCEGELIELSVDYEGISENLIWQISNDGLNFTNLNINSIEVENIIGEKTIRLVSDFNLLNNKYIRAATQYCGNRFIYSSSALIIVNDKPSLNIEGVHTICQGDEYLFNATGIPFVTWSGGFENNTLQVVNSTTVFTASGFTTQGCFVSENVTINVTPIYILNNSYSICQGESVTVGNSVYTTAGDYENQFVSSLGCDSIVYSHITVNPLPSIFAGNNEDFYICNGQQVTLSGFGGVEYTWNNGVINGQPFSPNQTTTYTVTGTDVNGCVNTNDVTVTVISQIEDKDIAGSVIECYGDFANVEVFNSQPIVQYYLVNDLSGQIVDGPVTGNSGTIILEAGEINQETIFNVLAENLTSNSKSLKLNGTNEYISIPNASPLNIYNSGFTIEAWINISNINQTNWAGIFSKALSNNAPLFKGWQLVLVNNKFMVEFSDNSQNLQVTGNKIINDNSWHFVSLVIDISTNKFELYIDGTLDVTFTSPLINQNINSNENLFIGIDRDKINYVNAKFDELRVWRTSRNQSEILSSMYNKLYGSENNLVAYYNFDNSNGQTISDLSAFANTGNCINTDVSNIDFGVLSQSSCSLTMIEKASFVVDDNISFVLQPQSVSACYNDDVTFEYTLSGTPDVTKWYSSANDGDTWQEVQPSNNVIITQNSLSILQATPNYNGFKYKLVAEKCNIIAATSQIAILNVNNLIVNSVSQDLTSLMANIYGATYQWLDCNNSMNPIVGETNQIFVPTIDGNYAVEITQNNCSAISDCFVHFIDGSHEDQEAIINNITASNYIICLGESVTLTVNGLLNDATAWFLYSGSCGEQLIETNSTGIFNVTPLNFTTYYIRGESATLQGSECTTISIDVSDFPNLTTAGNITICDGNEVTLFASSNGIVTWEDGFANGFTFIPTESAIYNVTAVNEYGCITNSSLSVVVEQSATFSQNITINIGEIFYVGTSAYSTEGTYIDILEGWNGCDSTVTTNLTVIPEIFIPECDFFSFAIPENVFPTLNPFDENVNLIATLQNGEPLPNWLIFDPETLIFSGQSTCDILFLDILITAQSNGKITETYSFTIQFVNANSISENSIEGINLYPNPATDKFILEFTETGNYKIDIYSSIGKKVNSFDFTGNKTEISINNLSVGMYLIKVSNNEKISTLPLIVK